MRRHCLREGLIWGLAVSGEPIGWTAKDDSLFERDMANPGRLPTRESALRVSRAFGGWIRDRFPDKQDAKGGYFVASADGPYKVLPSRKPENERIRRRNGNFFSDQGQAHRASEALRWLCQRERDRFEESAVQSVRA